MGDYKVPWLLTAPKDISEFVFAQIAEDSVEGRRDFGSLACVSLQFKDFLSDHPLLWKYVEFSMLWDETKITNVWKAATQKAGNHPLVVFIHDIGAKHARLFDTLKDHIKKGVKISSLTLELYQADGLGIDQLTQFPWEDIDPLQTLTLRYMDPASFDDIHENVLFKLPSTIALCMENIEMISAVPKGSWITNLESLKLGCNDCSCLHQFLLKTPSLVNLELTDAKTGDKVIPYDSSNFSTTVTLSKLKGFKVDTDYIWLDKLVCPALTSFTLGSSSIPHDFLDAHSSTITSLQVYGTNNLRELSLRVPRVTQLCLASSNWIAHTDPARVSRDLDLLPLLEELIIHDDQAKITLDMFTVLVSKGELPRFTEVVPQEKQRLKLLTILTPKDAADSVHSWKYLPFVPKGMVEDHLKYFEDPCGFKEGHPNCSKYTMMWIDS